MKPGCMFMVVWFVAMVLGGSLLLAREEAPVATDLDKIKALVGSWESDKVRGPDGKPAMTAEFRITAGGSAVIETMFPGSPHEMVNLYTMDGPTLIVTHYCASGNQPTLKLISSDSGVMKFDCRSVANLAGPEATHMGALEIRIDGTDHLIQDWSTITNGQVESHAQIDLQRVKK